MNASSDEPASRPVAVVTGAAQGLGLAAARALVREGFDVAAIDLHEQVPDGVREALPADRFRYYQLDIADLGRHEAVLAAVRSDFGRLDCLVNNAEIAARPLADILDLGAEAFDR